jgi:hypothetical protein
MSWLFSRALVAEYSAANSSDGAPSALSNTTPTPPAFLWRDKTTDAWSRFPSGMTCEPLTDDRGEALLTWFREGFLAKTYQQETARASASTDHEAECGDTWRESFARWDRASSSWKTPQSSLLEDLDAFSETWPRWGMMRGGACSARTIAAPPTNEIAFGLWPTPCASDTSDRRPPAKPHFTKNGTIKHVGKNGVQSQIRLSQAIKFRTPNASDGAKWSNQTREQREAKGQQVRLCHQLGAGGKMNPDWVEWLMGWPIGFTDCAASATDKFQQWLRSHGVCSEGQTPILCQGEGIK